MLNRVPLGSASGIVADHHLDPQSVGELLLELLFPQMGAEAIASAGIGQDQQLALVRESGTAFQLSPVGNGVHGKLGCVC
jgi:hypothetical protein